MNRSAQHFVTISAAATVIMASLPLSAHGQVSQWINPAGGFYETPSNWSLPGVPPPTNNIIFGVAGAYEIGFLGDQMAHDLLVANGVNLAFDSAGPSGEVKTYQLSGEATIENASLALGVTSDDGYVNLGVAEGLNVSGSELMIHDGAQVIASQAGSSTSFLDGFGAGSSRVEVYGADAAGQASRLELSTLFVGGDVGPATLSIADGGQASAASTAVAGALNASGSLLEVRGTAPDGTASSFTSQFLTVGVNFVGSGVATGALQIADGAFASNTGVQITLDSQVLVQGEDAAGNPSRWETSSLDNFGGRIEITGGASVSSSSANLTRLAQAFVTTQGSASNRSSWEIAGPLNLGGSTGFGTLTVNQGQLSSGSAQIGLGTGSSLLTVGIGSSGISSWDNSGDVSVGGSFDEEQASGSLRLMSDGARVTIDDELTIWQTGSVTISGGVFTVREVDHMHSGEFDWQQGLLDVEDFHGDLVNQGGVLAPGNDAADATSIFGNYTQESDAALSIGIGGKDLGTSYDAVDVDGDAQIGGALEVTLLGDFAPDASDTFFALVADDLSGFFSNIGTGQRIDTSDGRGSFVVNYGIGSDYDENRVVLSDFLPALPGDFDVDGDVDGDDYVLWQLGESPHGGSAGDLADWKANYGAPLGLPTARAEARNVPEPASLGWLLAAAPLRRRGRRTW